MHCNVIQAAQLLSQQVLLALKLIEDTLDIVICILLGLKREVCTSVICLMVCRIRIFEI